MNISQEKRLRPVVRRVGGQKLAGLLGKVHQDRVRVENEHPIVIDRGDLAVGIDLQKFRLELVSLAGIDRHQFVGEAGLLQKQSDLVRVGRSVEVKLEHSNLP